MKRIKAIILRNELEEDHNSWLKACEEYKDDLEYRVVNLTSNNWLEEIQKHPYNILLAKPGGLTAAFKQLYDERIYILERVLGYKVYPSAEEILIYENKRFLSYWLKANNIPHPSTHVFYNQAEARDHLIAVSYPIVAKANIGASGSGIKILKSQQQALSYLNHTFKGKGAFQRSGPNLSKGGLIIRGMHYFSHSEDISKKLKIYKTIRLNPQKGFVIFQEYISHEFEWRVVRVGDSFFAHKKLKIGEKTSGSTLKGYENPPIQILDFVKEMTNKYKFFSQAVDIFEDKNWGYLVNEMQCMFGQSDPYQMLVNGKPGRYRDINNKWVFEEGDFARNACFDLRVEYIIKQFLRKPH